jgi:hypothetical protein
MGVIAVGGSGGAAREQWTLDVASADSYRLGERPVEPGELRRLGDQDPGVAAASALGLITPALFLS